jgi:beta-barrel assembly-enhancing protease
MTRQMDRDFYNASAAGCIHFVGVSSAPLTYAARCFNSSSEADQETIGTVRFEGHNLRFDADGFALHLPLETLVIERAVGKQLLFSDVAQPGFSIVVPGLRILEHVALTRRPHLVMQVRKIREMEASGQRLRLTFVFLGTISLIAILALSLGRWVTNYLVGRIPISWEEQLGDAVYQEVSESVSIAERPELVAYLEDLSSQVLRGVPQNRYNLQFHIVESQVPNAFALPGGRIFVHTALFHCSPEQLAGVMAHEIAHVTRRHGVRHIVAATGPYLVLGAFLREKQGLFAILREGSGFLIQQNYSREYEKEADETAWKFLVAANIDPRGLADFLRTIHGDPTALLESSSLRLLQSHPPTSERIERLEEHWTRLQPRSGFAELPAVPRETNLPKRRREPGL